MKPGSKLLVVVVLTATAAAAQTPSRGPHAAARGLASSSGASSRASSPLASSPLTERERALQLLNRFTFGPRPGELDRVLAEGADAWFERQLSPEAIPDAALAKRLAEYPTLAMTPDKALATFPDNGVIRETAAGKLPMPTDPQLAAVYEVILYKYRRDEEQKRRQAAGNALSAQAAGGTGSGSSTAAAASAVAPSLNETELAAQKAADQATAARLAGELLAQPREARMGALLRLPVEQRAAFATYVGGDLKNQFLAQWNAHERELFQAMSSGPSAYPIVNELKQAKLLRATLSERELLEVMTDFWFNHFNVFAGKDADQWYTTSYEREAIRKHALGKFRDLLFATAESPAMMVYLDNALSVGPNSVANGVNPANPRAKKGSKGLNENYGREVMELHTVGVNGGYTQADVTALSAILTGWTVDRPNLGGPFLFDQRRHEPGEKRWFGQTIAEGRKPDGSPDGMREGTAALETLARSPKTAHFVSYLLAQRFVADQPPPALVDRLAATYTATDGDIKAVLRALVRSPEFNARLYFRNKVKTPLEFVASAFRATATDPTNPGALVGTLKSMGMPPYEALPPTGYYVPDEQWMNSTAIVDRLAFAEALTANHYGNQRFDAARLLTEELLTSSTALGEARGPVGTGTPPSRRAGQAGTAGSRARVVAIESDASSERVVPPEVGRAASLPSASMPVAASSEGMAFAENVLEHSLLGVAARPETNALIRREMPILTSSSGSAIDGLNVFIRLLLGSPDFQLR